MKTRDRVLSAVLVGSIIAFIWWGGSEIRSCVGPSSSVDASAEASASASASSSAHPHASTSASAQTAPVASVTVANVVDAAPPPISGACKTMNDASQKKIDDAKSARGACTITFDMSTLSCRTSQNGATWGMRIDDVVDLGECATGFLVRLVHLDVNGAETAMVPGISSQKLAHTYDVVTVATPLQGVDSITQLEAATFFDWDGDGEDEVFVHATRGVGEQKSGVWTFKNSHITPYAPATPIANVVATRDIDSDGRPDLIVKLFGTHEFVAHSLADGTFTLHDSVAVSFAEKTCPSDPAVDLSTIDDAAADAIVCKLIWGHDPKPISNEVAKACGNHPCPLWVAQITTAKPPLSLR